MHAIHTKCWSTPTVGASHNVSHSFSACTAHRRSRDLEHIKQHGDCSFFCRNNLNPSWLSPLELTPPAQTQAPAHHTCAEHQSSMKSVQNTPRHAMVMVIRRRHLRQHPHRCSKSHTWERLHQTLLLRPHGCLITASLCPSNCTTTNKAC